MLIDIFKKMPYDDGMESVFDNTSEDEDLQDLSDYQVQCSCYNMFTGNIITSHNTQKTLKKKENKSK